MEVVLAQVPEPEEAVVQTPPLHVHSQILMQVSVQIRLRVVQALGQVNPGEQISTKALEQIRLRIVKVQAVERVRVIHLCHLLVEQVLRGVLQTLMEIHIPNIIFRLTPLTDRTFLLPALIHL